MLRFEPVTLDMKEMMEGYFLAWGEGSCQHSFASSFCLSGKYGDCACEQDGFLYILRSKAGGARERAYLFPQGDMSDRETARKAIANVLDDAHGHGALVRFDTLTARATELVLDLFPGTFAAAEDRDRSEYVYSIGSLLALSGHELASRRKKIHRFFNKYGDRCRILPIAEGHIEPIRSFQRHWLDERTREVGRAEIVSQLADEDAGIQLALDHFFELGLSGVVAFIDGQVRGYEYGAPLSADCFDAMVQKGDREIPDICRILDRELLRLCCCGYAWVNWEEDLGSEGLRTMKTLRGPDHMIQRWVVREVAG